MITVPKTDHELAAETAHETHAEGDLTAEEQLMAVEEEEQAKRKAVLDHFGALQGEFENAADQLGNTHELRMAKSHTRQATEWIHRHLHPDPSATTMPDAPPPAPPLAG